jgi:penicillin V acylase-like amidase (Ntn superfamily)
MGMRYLLDNCKNTTEAKEALLGLKHYYAFIPCHYIVADREGRSFLFELSADRETVHIMDGEGPQCITNHLVYQYPDVDNLPPGWTFRRYRMLYEAISGDELFAFSEIEAINKSVAVPPGRSGNQEFAPGRTLWYAVYDTQESSLKVTFYLGESPDPEDESRVVIDYTDYLEFKLK